MLLKAANKLILSSEFDLSLQEDESHLRFTRSLTISLCNHWDNITDPVFPNHWGLCISPIRQIIFQVAKLNFKTYSKCFLLQVLQC